MLASFRYHRPTSIGEATRLLGALGDDARIYAGGTELLLAMREGLIRCGHLVDIKHMGLDGITFDEETNMLWIGATTTHRAVEHSELVATYAPLLASMEHHLANVRVRATGTVGGNLCFAEPRSDLATVLLVYGATVIVGNIQGQRSIKLEEFILDSYTTSLASDELLIRIEIAPLPEGIGTAYQKVAFYERPTVSVCAAILPETDGASVREARIAVGGASSKPMRVFDAEQALTDVPLRGHAFGLALNSAVGAVQRVCSTYDDFYGSAEYKRHLAGVLVRRVVEAARDRALAKRGPHVSG
jgi:carbon-monoxide dehydrogenase medium subunit